MDHISDVNTRQDRKNIRLNKGNRYFQPIDDDGKPKWKPAYQQGR